jgi:predicted lipoprotein with Yx(FWY)xxD motif
MCRFPPSANRWSGVSRTMLALLCLTFGNVGLVSAADDQLVAPAGIAYAERGYGWLLTDADGKTLYHYAFDQTPGQSACNDRCASRWPPVAVLDADASAPSDEWSHVNRADGSLQWAYRDKPLYRYVADAHPGNTFGDRFQRQWTLAQRFRHAPRGVDVARADPGYVLTDNNGAVLYYSTEESEDRIGCDAICARTWRPLAAPLMASAQIEHWTSVRRPDGSRQWAHKGRPVYTYAGDRLAGDTRGHELGPWRAVVVEPRPETPDWVRVHFSDSSMLVLADPQGRTLYTRSLVQIRSYALAAIRPCDPECPGSDWEPALFAQDQARPRSNDAHWALQTREDGSEQWLYNGEPVYVNRRDGKMPGLLNGIRGGDRAWMVLTLSGEQIPGTFN